jgi:radical SAM-linked protein
MTFSKTDALRFTSHLDLYRTWERTFRRANLPLAYSQGFSPHPRINLASALPLGFTSEGEILEFWLEKALTIEDISAMLAPALPSGLIIREIKEVDQRLPALQSNLLASEYQITFLEDIPDLTQKCHTLLEAPTLPRRRNNKEYDLRPLLMSLTPISEDEEYHSRIIALLTAGEGKTGRPEEVISELGVPVEQTRVHRLRLIFKKH